jgi:hypothetical protein
MKRLWVVEATFKDGSIDICDFAERQFAFTNFYKAHRVKKEILNHLCGITKRWRKKDITVKEYLRRTR